MGTGSVKVVWHEYKRDWEQVEAQVIEEAIIEIYANGVELARIMSTPNEQDFLGVGFLKNEGFIESIADVDHIHVSEDGCCVDVWLKIPVKEPDRKIITSGCGGGVTFDDPSKALDPIEDEIRISPETLVDLIGQLHFPGSLHARTRGVHAAGITDGERILVAAEDVGRHNTIDKLVGACLIQGITTKGRILMATGRVSSEMLRKGALMGCPIIVSRNSPTSMSVAMAEAWNITLVGYVRRGSIRVYSHPYRLGYEVKTALPPATD